LIEGAVALRHAGFFTIPKKSIAQPLFLFVSINMSRIYKNVCSPIKIYYLLNIIQYDPSNKQYIELFLTRLVHTVRKKKIFHLSSIQMYVRVPVHKFRRET